MDKNLITAKEGMHVAMHRFLRGKTNSVVDSDSDTHTVHCALCESGIPYLSQNSRKAVHLREPVRQQSVQPCMSTTTLSAYEQVHTAH